MIKKVGKVTESEKKKILNLFERKLGLEELLLTLNEPDILDEIKDTLLDKIPKDMSKTTMLYDKWWQDMSSKYNWEFSDGMKWSINFETNEVHIKENI